MMRILTSLALSLALVATTAHAGTYNITVDKVEIDTGVVSRRGENLCGEFVKCPKYGPYTVIS